MVRSRHQVAPIHLIDLYLILSFVASLILWIGMWQTNVNFLPNSFWISSLVAINYIGFSHGLGLGTVLSESKSFGGLLLTQYALLIGCALEHESIAIVFVAILPCLAACYAQLASERNLSGGMFSKDLVPPLIGLGSYLGFVAAYRALEWRTIDILALVSFTFWTVGTLYWGSALVKRESRSILGLILRRNSDNRRWRMDQDRLRDERLFFHDVINHTHGLNLFLQQKLSSNDVLVPDEVKAMMGEVKALQSLVAHHYGFKHKNLLTTLEWVEIDYAMASFHRLLHTMLPTEIEIRFHQSGMLDRRIYDRSRLNLMVHYPTFLRVCTNLVKNIAEQSPKIADFSFEAQMGMLSLCFKNKMGHLHDTKKDLEHALSHTILAADHDEEREHLGLESVQVLCQEHGGHFDFSIVEGEWVARVDLPLKNIADLPQNANDLKKAA